MKECLLRRFFHTFRTMDKIPRINSNTATLQERFPEIYTEFFAKSNIACSASSSFYWVGELAVLFGGPAIMQKLPLRAYTGLEFVDRPEIKLAPYFAYEPSSQQFARTNWPAYESGRMLEFINQEFAVKKNKSSAGICIHVLNETPPSRGLNSSGAFAASLAAVLHMWVGELTSKDIDKWTKYTSTENLMADKKFRLVAATAWKIENIYHSDAASGAGWAAAMVFSNYPIFFMTEYRVGDWDDHGQARFPANPSGRAEIFDKMEFVIRRLDEFFPVKEHFGFPIDYGLISTGRAKEIATLKASNKINTRIIKSVDQFVQAEVAPNLHPLTNSAMHQSQLIQGGWEALWWAGVTGPLTALTLSTLKLFRMFYNDAYSEATVASFLHNLHTYDHWLYMLGTTGEGIRPILRAFRSSIDPNPFSSLHGIKITGAGKVGGDILFAVPTGTLREQMEKRILALRKKFTNQLIMLDYASWLDGYGKEGLKVEQDLPEAIYSDFVSPGSIQIIQFRNGGSPRHYLAKGSEYKKLVSQNDLVIDLIDEKVVVGGKVPTSKELPSATTTAQVVSRLLQSPEGLIHSNTLPRSSYSSNRNDMQSKIMTPLNKLLQKRLGKTLPIELHGDYNDFHLQLAPPADFSIVIAKRVL